MTPTPGVLTLGYEEIPQATSDAMEMDATGDIHHSDTLSDTRVGTPKVTLMRFVLLLKLNVQEEVPVLL